MTDNGKKRERSPNFPSIALETALVKARQLYDREKRGMTALSVIAKHWGYSLKSSGFLQAVGALKTYGLMEDEGRGLDRRARLTEFALRILLDPRVDSPERKGLIRDAALNPGIAQAILERYPDNPPSEENLEHFLIFDLGFQPGAAKLSVKTFLENNAFAGIYGADDHGTILPETEPNQGRSDLMLPALTSSGSATSLPMEQVAAGVPVVEQITGPEGPIMIKFMGWPTWEVLDFLENYIKLRKSILKPGAAIAAKETTKE